MKDQAIDILRRSQLSVTDSRRIILNLFLQNNKGALRHSDIEKTADSLDRVTIYRTLQVFAENGIIHPIPSVDGAARYALCRTDSEGKQHDNHVHFQCTECGIIQCIENVNVPQVSLPMGYKTNQISMVLTGVCVDCK